MAGHILSEWIAETSPPMLLATALALIPTALAARERLGGAPVRERALLWLLALPLGAAALVLHETWTILNPPSVSKIDPRFWAFLRASSALVQLGPALVVATLGALLAPGLRRGALALLPAALVIAVWGHALRVRLQTIAQAAPPDKAELWARWQPVHTSLLVALALCTTLALSRSAGPARWVVAAPLLPLLLWPGWVPWLFA